MAGALPESGIDQPSGSIVRTPGQVQQVSERTQLLSQTRGALAGGSSGSSSPAQSEAIRPVLEAILAKLDSLSDRPIEVQVTTTLDGRKIAQAVYKDMKERRVKNYETL
jgi:hypothetical protein